MAVISSLPTPSAAVPKTTHELSSPGLGNESSTHWLSPAVYVQLAGPPETSVYGPPKQQSFFTNGEQHLSRLNEQMSQALEQGPNVRDLSQSLIDFLHDGQSSVHQQLDRYTYQNTGGNWVEPSFNELEIHTVHAKSELSFGLTTQSGDKLTFKLHYEKGLGSTPRYTDVGYESVAIDFELEGQLSLAERKEILALADKLNALANDYFESGSIDLDSLDLADLTEVAELSLSLDGGMTEITSPFSLPYHDKIDYGLDLKFSDGIESRHIEAVADGNKLSATLDKLGVVDGYDLERREAALAKYRQQLVEGVSRARGGDEDRQLLLAAFDALHGELEEAKDSIELSDDEVAMLTAVADFRMSYLSRVGTRNPDEARQHQNARFSLDIAQETQLHQYTNGNLDIEQQQSWRLKGTYFGAAPGKSEVNFRSGDQNYRYHEVQEDTQLTTALERRGGILVSAEQSVEADAKLETLLYQDDQLAKWTTANNHLAEKTNLLALYTDSSVNPELTLLDSLLLNIDAVYQRSEKSMSENDPSEAPKYLRGEGPAVFANEAAQIEA